MFYFGGERMKKTMLSAGFLGVNLSLMSFGYDEESTICSKIKNALYTQICELYKNGVYIFYSSCFMGLEMWAAEIILKLHKLKEFENIQLICCIPYEEQASKWPENIRERYYDILEKSNMNLFIQRRYTKDCISNCNKFIIKHSHFIIALSSLKEQFYDNKFNDSIIEYANNLNKGIIIINSETADITPITISSSVC